MTSKAIEELEKGAFTDGVAPNERVVTLAFAQRIVGELEAQLERRQADLPLACPRCKKLIGYNVGEQQ